MMNADIYLNCGKNQVKVQIIPVINVTVLSKVPLVNMVSEVSEQLPAVYSEFQLSCFDYMTLNCAHGFHSPCSDHFVVKLVITNLLVFGVIMACKLVFFPVLQILEGIDYRELLRYWITLFIVCNGMVCS